MSLNYFELSDFDKCDFVDILYDALVPYDDDDDDDDINWCGRLMAAISGAKTFTIRVAATCRQLHQNAFS